MIFLIMALMMFLIMFWMMLLNMILMMHFDSDCDHAFGHEFDDAFDPYVKLTTQEMKDRRAQWHVVTARRGGEARPNIVDSESSISYLAV